MLGLFLCHVPPDSAATVIMSTTIVGSSLTMRSTVTVRFAATMRCRCVGCSMGCATMRMLQNGKLPCGRFSVGLSLLLACTSDALPEGPR